MVRSGSPGCLLTVLVLSGLCPPGRLVASEMRDTVPLDAFPAPLQARHTRSEQDEDRLQAAAAFAHGRILLHQGDRAGALRRWERAWRYDPQSQLILREMLPLANSLNRLQEAARYAILAAEQRPEDPRLLRQLGALLIEQNELPRAVGMFEAAQRLERDDPPDRQTVSLQIELGRLYFIQGRQAAAADQFAQVLQTLEDPQRAGMSPSDWKQILRKPEMLFSLMGESFLLAQRYQEAVAVFQRAHQELPDEALLACQLARVHAARHEWPDAAAQLERYFQAGSSVAGREPYALLAEVLAGLEGDPRPAAQRLDTRLRELRQADPDNLPLAYYLAGRHLDQGRLEEAATLYGELLARLPASEAYQGLCAIYRQQDDPDRLLALLGRAVAQANSLDLLGDERTRLVENRALQDRLFERVQTRLDASPRDLDQSQCLAVTLLAAEAERYELAEQFGQAALRAAGRPQLETLEMLALTLYIAGENERAVRWFRRALAEQPPTDKAAEFHYYLAGALAATGDTEAAIESARQAAAQAPDGPRWQSREAWILFHARRYPEARQAYLQFLDRFDGDYDRAPTRDAVRQARLILSSIEVLQDQPAAAEEWLEQVLDEFPDDVGAWNDLGYLWADQGKHLERALRMVRQAVDAEPDNVAYRDSLGWALYRTGRYKEAVAELERATRGEDPDGLILDHLGDAYLQANQPEEAVRAWRQAADVLRRQELSRELEMTEAKIRRHGSP